jgi:general secretion pathway protein A
MYTSYFNLTRNPFDLTPDPVCFVPTGGHNEALAALYYGVRYHKGFVVATGEVGTGKTLLLRCLLRLFSESRDIAYAYVFNGRLSPVEFLQYTLADFGLTASGKSKYELLLDFGHFLQSQAKMKMTSVLIVDEAHLLSADILEEIRLLSNLETSDEKLLQIVLVGQPELDAKLDSFELRQLKQRIAIRTHLASLNFEETSTYIAWRIQIAGNDVRSERLFSEDAIERVYRYSRGLPRLINSLCDNALLTAFGKHISTVPPEIIDDVAKQLRIELADAPDRRANTSLTAALV